MKAAETGKCDQSEILGRVSSQDEGWTSTWFRLVLPAVLVGSCLGCAPLTFSNEGAIDFERYRAVRVSVSAPIADASEYLAKELRASSGFDLVTTDSSVAVDLLLTVDVSVNSETTVDSEGDTDTQSDSAAHYRALDPTGRVVVEGDTDDESEWSDEAAEDALDEVALVFLRDYRL